MDVIFAYIARFVGNVYDMLILTGLSVIGEKKQQFSVYSGSFFP